MGDAKKDPNLVFVISFVGTYFAPVGISPYQDHGSWTGQGDYRLSSFDKAANLLVTIQRLKRFSLKLKSDSLTSSLKHALSVRDSRQIYDFRYDSIDLNVFNQNDLPPDAGLGAYTQLYSHPLAAITLKEVDASYWGPSLDRLIDMGTSNAFEIFLFEGNSAESRVSGHKFPW